MWIVLRGRGTVAASPGLPAGLPLTAALDRVAAGGAPEDTAITLAGHDYRVRTQARPGPQAVQVQVVLDEAPAEAQRAALLRALCMAGLVGLVLTAAVGVGLGRRAVRPLQTALAVQRRFVADAGHELRTPLTLLSTRAQMLRRKLPRHDTAEKALAPRSTRWSPTRGGSPPSSTTCCSPPTRGHRPTTRSSTSPRSRRPSSTPPGSARPGWASPWRSPRPPRLPSGVRKRDFIAPSRRSWTTRCGTPRPVVTVSVSTVGRRAVVEIADDGPGIDAAVLPRVFERFATTGTERPGVTRRYGIGLALVGDVVARHGGTVDARNRPEGGAVFTLNLPGVSKTTPRIGRHPRH